MIAFFATGSFAAWVLGVFIYVVIGALMIIITAYLHKLILNESWFRGLWAEWNGSVPPPALVFLFWPAVIPLIALGFLVSGFFAGITSLANKADLLAAEQRKKTGDRRDNR